MIRMLRIPGPRGRHVYVSAGRMLSPDANARRYAVTRGSGLTMRLLRVAGRYAILVQSFRRDA